jgi:hypothetical protein
MGPSPRRTASATALAALLLTLPVAGRAQDVELFVLAGQSNALAAGTRADELPLELAAAEPGIAFWFEEGPLSTIMAPGVRLTSAGAFQPLQFQSDPEGALFWRTGDGFGPELTLARALAPDGPGEVALVKFVIGGSSLARDWRPGAGPLFRQLRNAVLRALQALRDAGRIPRLAGVFWVQGEADAQRRPPAVAYAANLQLLIARLRLDLRAPHLPFVVSRLRSGLPADQFPFRAAVRVAQERLTRRVGNTAVVDTDDLGVRPDDLHHDSAGTLELGRRLAMAYLAPPALSATDLIAVEGGGTRRARMRVFLTGVNHQGVTVDYATREGTALEGEDYEAVSGTLSFPPGVVSRTVIVPVLGDAWPEQPAEHFSLELTRAVGAELANARGVCVIRDDDGQR